MADEKFSQQETATTRNNLVMYGYVTSGSSNLDKKITVNTLLENIANTPTAVSTNLTAGVNSINTSLTTRPHTIEVWQTDPSDSARVINRTKDFQISVRLDSTYYIDIYTTEAITNIIIDYSVRI